MMWEWEWDLFRLGPPPIVQFCDAELEGMGLSKNIVYKLRSRLVVESSTPTGSPAGGTMFASPGPSSTGGLQSPTSSSSSSSATSDHVDHVTSPAVPLDKRPPADQVQELQGGADHLHDPDDRKNANATDVLPPVVASAFPSLCVRRVIMLCTWYISVGRELVYRVRVSGEGVVIQTGGVVVPRNSLSIAIVYVASAYHIVGFL